MYKLSIIVPAHGLQAQIDDTLLSVLENRPPQCEVVVPHARTYRDPYDLADEVRFIPCDQQDLASLLNAALGASQADIVHTLIDVQATPQWTSSPTESLERSSEWTAAAPQIRSRQQASRLAGVGVRYRASGRREIVGAGRRWERRLRDTAIDAPLVQAGFWRRQSLLEIGGFRSCFGPVQLDADLAARFRARGWQCGYCPDSQTKGEVWTDEPGFASARNAERLYRTHAASSGQWLSHVAWCGWEVIKQLPHPRAITVACGRLAGRWGGCPAAESAPLRDAIGDESDELISVPFPQAAAASRPSAATTPLRRSA